MILVVDNYDSFTYNLVQYLGELGADVRVKRNNTFALQDVEKLPLTGIVISPGPGQPQQAGLTMPTVEQFGKKGVPILGVCLGHQAIGAVFGANVVRAGHIMHGKTSPIFHEGKGVFANLPTPFRATRYHSLILDETSLPDSLEVTARSDDGYIMGVRHLELPIEGVQFHPESIMTEYGHELLQNFLRRCAV